MRLYLISYDIRNSERYLPLYDVVEEVLEGLGECQWPNVSTTCILECSLQNPEEMYAEIQRSISAKLLRMGKSRSFVRRFISSSEFLAVLIDTNHVLPFYPVPENGLK